MKPSLSPKADALHKAIHFPPNYLTAELFGVQCKVESLYRHAAKMERQVIILSRRIKRTVKK